MESQPEMTPPADGPAPAFGAGDRVLAAVLLLGAAVLGYVCLDVMAGGRITAALSRHPTDDIPEEES